MAQVSNITPSAEGEERSSGSVKPNVTGEPVRLAKGTSTKRKLTEATPSEVVIPIKPMATRAKIRPRHRILVASFLVLVALPTIVSAVYLWTKAADQFASTVGFSIRKEEAGSAMDALSGLSGLVGVSSSSTPDADILYQFMKSQKLVADLDAKLDLRNMWSKATSDPVFAFNPNGSIEDLVDYWTSMVHTSFDSQTGLIEIQVRAFTADDATRIAQALLDESAQTINDLSVVAREDAIRYSRDDLVASEDRLRTAREAVTKFRVVHQIVDPTTAIQSQAGIVSSLQNELANAEIEIDLLGDSVSPSDPRLLQAQRRVEVINARIEKERSKVGLAVDGKAGDDYAEMVGEYERLTVEREFAERTYVAALAAYDSALAEARRKSRYLAPHIKPTTAEVSRYPQRFTILGMIAVLLTLTWAIGSLVVYSLKDRR